MWSADLQGPWVTAVTRPVSASMPVSVAVTGLLPNTRYVFIVRASNSHGLSRPSAITQTVRTKGMVVSGVVTTHEIRNKLSSPSIRLINIEPISSTSLRISMQILVDTKLLEGVHLRYRLMDLKRDIPTGALKSQTVFLKSIDKTHLPISHILTGLSPGSGYEIFIVPFHGIIVGQPSVSMRGTTFEVPPTVPPSGLHYTLVNSTTLKLTWDPITGHNHVISYNLLVSSKVMVIIHLYVIH